jgi:hypothetical protein
MFSSSRPRAMPREGIALPIALAAIVTVGALITGVFFASTQEFRVGRNTLATQRAMHAAETGLGEVVASWDAARTTGTKVGQTVTMPLDTIDGAAVVQVQYTKVSPTVFWVTSTAVAGSLDLQARSLKRLNTVVRIQTPDFKIMGAVTSRGLTNVSGSASLSGTDTVPSGWDCPPGGAQGAGIVVNDSASNVTTGGTKYTINGTPQIKDSTALVKDTMTYTKFGGFSYDSLATLATKVRTGGGTIGTVAPQFKVDGSCDPAHADNWGASSHPSPCASYFPVVHLKGAAASYTINGSGGGQGIMLVDGNLSIQGTFRWTGLVLVRGTFSISGTGGPAGGAKVVGAVAAMNRGGGTNMMSGTSNISFSRCVINQVTAQHAVAAPMSYRGWADLSF